MEVTTEQTLRAGRVANLLMGVGNVKAAVSLRISRLVREINKEFKTVSEEQVKLFKKYPHDEKDGQITVKQDSPEFPDFVKERDEFLAAKVTRNWEIVTLPADATNVPPFVLEALEGLVDVAEETKK